MPLSIECDYAEWHYYLYIMLRIIRLNVVMLSVVMLNAVILNIVTLCVVLPLKWFFCLAVWLFASPLTPLLTSHFIKMFESNFSFLYLTSFNISTSFRGMEIKKGKNSLFAVKSKIRSKNQISSNSCNFIGFSPSFLSPCASGGFRTIDLTIMSRGFYH